MMWFYLQNIATGLVLDAKMDDSRKIITFTYNGGDNQLFMYENGMIYSKYNGNVMDVTTKDSKVILWPQHGGLNQKWTFNADFTIQNHLGKVLDIKSKPNKISGELIAWPKHGGENQKFRRVYV